MTLSRIEQWLPWKGLNLPSCYLRTDTSSFVPLKLEEPERVVSQDGFAGSRITLGALGRLQHRGSGNDSGKWLAGVRGHVCPEHSRAPPDTQPSRLTSGSHCPTPLRSASARSHRVRIWVGQWRHQPPGLGPQAEMNSIWALHLLWDLHTPRLISPNLVFLIWTLGTAMPASWVCCRNWMRWCIRKSLHSVRELTAQMLTHSPGPAGFSYLLNYPY